MPVARAEAAMWYGPAVQQTAETEATRSAQRATKTESLDIPCKGRRQSEELSRKRAGSHENRTSICQTERLDLES